MITIRAAKQTDAFGILSVLVPMIEEFVLCDFPEHGKSLIRKHLNEETLINNFKSGFEYTVAEYQGQIIGFIAMRDNAHIFNLFVDKTYHRKGISRRLWNEALKKCLKKGNQGKFTVNASIYSIPVYEKFGFRCTGNVQEEEGVIFSPMILMTNS